MEEHMPLVTAQLRRRRAEGQGAYIDECWRRGVMQQEPGWFFAAEGPVSIGVPISGVLSDPVLVEMRRSFPDQAIVMLKERADGQA